MCQIWFCSRSECRFAYYAQNASSLLVSFKRNYLHLWWIPCHSDQKRLQFWYKLAVFFYPLRSNGISSPHEVWWISSKRAFYFALFCISSRFSVYWNSVMMIYNAPHWWYTRPKARYTRFRTDDIQPLHAWWYTLSAKVINISGLFIFSRKNTNRSLYTLIVQFMGYRSIYDLLKKTLLLLVFMV